jgi:hypothetical protein
LHGGDPHAVSRSASGPVSRSAAFTDAGLADRLHLLNPAVPPGGRGTPRYAFTGAIMRPPSPEVTWRGSAYGIDPYQSRATA